MVDTDDPAVQEPRHLSPNNPPPRRRTIMNDLQQQVQEAVDRLVESGAERGLQVAVYLHGEPVVDAVAGVADPATGGSSATTPRSSSCGPSSAPTASRTRPYGTP